MKDVNLGISAQFQHAVEQKEPSIAIRESTILTTWGELDDLKYRIGKTDGAAVSFSGGGSVATGVQSSCGLARSQGRQGNLYAIEVHKSLGDDDQTDDNHNKLYAMVGRVDDTVVTWRSTPSFTIGRNPSVAINNSLYAVEVHRDAADNTLRYHMGSVTVQRGDEKVTWTPGGNGIEFGTGEKPAVAMNDSNQILLAWEHPVNNTAQIRMRRGALNRNTNTINLPGPPGADGAMVGPEGTDPSVALDNDGTAILMYRDPNGKLRHLVGRIDNEPIFPAGAGTEFEDGRRVALASHGGTAAQIHQSQDFNRLYYSTSLVTNRSNWMSDRLAALGGKSLSQLALPASHDAGLYSVVRHDDTGAAQTQALDLFEQLSQGFRYFDLRPRWDQNSNTFTIYHDIAGHGDTIGPHVGEVLDDVARFMKDHAELAILKFSHYSSFDSGVATSSGDPAADVDSRANDAKAQRRNARYRALTQLLHEKLGEYLYIKPANEHRRLAKIPLNDYLRNRRKGLVLVVCDEDYPVDNPSAGIYVYRDTGADPKGDLQVYDRYFETAGDFYTSLVTDQQNKFNNYTGQDDLFLLSWTLTPIPTTPAGETVAKLSAEPNQNLGTAIKDFRGNAQKQVNLVYINYVDTARATDVCLYLNGVPQPPAS